MNVSTREYEFAHGKAPRGKGSWAFFFDANCTVDGAFWVHQANYSDAKKAAVQEAKRRKAHCVSVGS